MNSLPLATLVLLAATTADLGAEVFYLGPGSTPGTAVIRDSDHGVRVVRQGDVLPEVGELREIGDDEVVFDRELGDAERQQLQAAGAVAPDIQRRHVYRRPEPVTGGPSSRSVLTAGGN